VATASALEGFIFMKALSRIPLYNLISRAH